MKAGRRLRLWLRSVERLDMPSLNLSQGRIDKVVLKMPRVTICCLHQELQIDHTRFLLKEFGGKQGFNVLVGSVTLASEV